MNRNLTPRDMNTADRRLAADGFSGGTWFRAGDNVALKKGIEKNGQGYLATLSTNVHGDLFMQVAMITVTALFGTDD